MMSIQQHSWSTAGTVAPGSQLCRLADAYERLSLLSDEFSRGPARTVLLSTTGFFR